jgi:hypothetical protein
MPETEPQTTPAASAAVSAAISAATPRFRHYKGGLYELICEATLESDLSTMIVYRASDGSIWTRPRDVFFQLIEIDGVKVQRFTPLD